MKFHHCLFKILKNQNVADGWMDGWMDKVKTVYPTPQTQFAGGIKTTLFVPPAYRCYMRNMVRIGFMASEEMSFENVDDDD